MSLPPPGTPDLFAYADAQEHAAARGGTLEERFWAFHRRNPRVYEVLRDLALAAHERKERYGIGALYEIARWERRLPIQGDDPWKLNNNLRSRYSRLLMEQEPALRGFFETRRLHDGGGEEDAA